MPSLNAIMSIAGSALNAMQGALSTTSNNVANSDTAGYTREVVDLTTAPTVSDGSSSYGAGVSYEGYTNVRDSVLQSQIYDQQSNVSSSEAQTNALEQAQLPFTSTSSGLGSDITSFFDNLSQLSTNPSSATLRASVYSSATTLVDDFHSASGTLSQLQSSLNQSVPDNVNQINQLTSQIAGLNQQIASAQDSGQESGTLQDQRDQLVDNLSKLTSVQVSKSDNSISITTGNGTTLVDGGTAYNLSTQTSASGSVEVLDQGGNDITSTLTGGSLGGTLTVLSSALPTLTTKLNNLASQFADAINTANKSGYDLNGKAGAALFSYSTTAAASISLSASSGSAIAASSDGTIGSDGNLSNLLAVQTPSLASGMTPINAYSDIIYNVGNAVSQSTTTNTAATAALAQLQTQQSSESGVNIDEETTNLLQYQQTYQAAAKVIDTVNTLFSTLINMSTS